MLHRGVDTVSLCSTVYARGASTIHHMTTSFAARVQDQDKTMQRVRAARESPHGNLGSAPLARTRKAKTRKLPDDHGIGIGMARPRSRTATYAKAKSPSVTSMHLARRHAAAAPSGPGPGTNHPPVDPSVLSPTVFVERSTGESAIDGPGGDADAFARCICIPSHHSRPIVRARRDRPRRRTATARACMLRRHRADDDRHCQLANRGPS